MSDTILELEHIEKHFGGTGVLHGVSLERAARRVCNAARPFGLRKDHHAAHHCRPGNAGRRARRAARDRT